MIGYDAGTVRLSVCAEPWARAARTHLEQTRAIKAVNESAAPTVIRVLRIPAPVPIARVPGPTAARVAEDARRARPTGR